MQADRGCDAHVTANISRTAEIPAFKYVLDSTPEHYSQHH